MREKLQVTFRGMDPSEFVDKRIEESATKLFELESRITGCHVTVESRHRHHHKGQIFHVCIDLTVPGAEIAVSREPEQDHSHEDVYVAIRDAFDAARRRLKDLAGRRSRFDEAKALDRAGTA